MKERALAWVPEAMRFAPAPGADPAEQTAPWDVSPTDQAIAAGDADDTDGASDNEEAAPAAVDEHCTSSALEAEPEAGGDADDAPPAVPRIEKAA